MRSVILALLATSQRIFSSYTRLGLINRSSCDLLEGEATVVPGVLVDALPEGISAGHTDSITYMASTAIRQREKVFFSGEYRLQCGKQRAGSLHLLLGDQLSDFIVNSDAVELSHDAEHDEVLLTDVLPLQ